MLIAVMLLTCTEISSSQAGRKHFGKYYSRYAVLTRLL